MCENNYVTDDSGAACQQAGSLLGAQAGSHRNDVII